MDNSMCLGHLQLDQCHRWLWYHDHKQLLLRYWAYLNGLVRFKVWYIPCLCKNDKPNRVSEACSSVMFNSVSKLVWFTKNVFEIIASAPALMNFWTVFQRSHSKPNLTWWASITDSREFIFAIPDQIGLESTSTDVSNAPIPPSRIISYARVRNGNF